MHITSEDIPVIILLLLIICFIITEVFSTDCEKYENISINADYTDNMGTGSISMNDSYSQNQKLNLSPQKMGKYSSDRSNRSMGSNTDEQISELRETNDKLKHDVGILTNIISKLYTTDMKGEYIVNGWFIQFHNIIETPGGLILGELLHKIYGVPLICFRVKEGYPFLGPPNKPMFFPKADNIGLRAMTILKIPHTGYYDFKILTDDGMRLYYQKVTSTVIQNEKNVRSSWDMIIDSWMDQAEVWTTSKKIYFNENDLVLLRMDYYELMGYASACIKLRRYRDDIKTNDPGNDHIEEMDMPYKNMFCSLLWSEVPLLGFA